MRPSRTICVLLIALFVRAVFLYLPELAFATPLGVGLAQEVSKQFDLEASKKLVRLADPQISPDGKSIILVVSRANYQDNRWEKELVLVEIATGTQRVLTYERKDASQPRWSPAGDQLAFLASSPTGKEPKPQIFVLPMIGGEGKRITSVPNGVQHYTWRPGGKEIAFVTVDETQNPKIADKEIAFEVGNDHYLSGAGAVSSHIWLVAASGGNPRRLTSGTWSLPVTLPPGSPSSPLSWSPDGKSIAFVKQATPHFGDFDQRGAQILDVASGAVRGLTSGTLFEGHPSFSPDGSRIAYWYPRDGSPSNVNEIHVTSAAGGAGTSLTRSLDRNLYRSIWMPDGKALLTGGNDATRSSLWIQPLEGAALRLDLGTINPAWLFWVDVTVGKDGAIAFTGSEAQRPTELYYLSSPNASPRRLTDFNGEVAALSLGKVETIDWTNDGFKMNGILTFPPDFASHRAYPLVLLIHGGPRAASTESFGALAQLMAARNWVVFQPNYRGSDNLGNKFQHAIFNDAGGDGPGRDVMAGIEAVKRRGFVDPSRIAVSGWSYGGYMTTWLIGHYPGWKVAVAGAAVTDWMDQYNLGDGNVTRRYGFGGSPWIGDFEKAYRTQSPITYASRIRTPTLVLSTTGDVRVPVTQSYSLYHALRDNGVTAKFVAYPVPGHSPEDPVRQLDVNRRWLEWLEQYLTQSASSQ